LKVGTGSLKFEADGEQLDIPIYTATPFLGANYRIAENLTLGYEMQMPLPIPKDRSGGDSDSSESDEEDSKVNLPQAYLLTLQYAFGGSTLKGTKNKSKKRLSKKRRKSKKDESAH
jgi:hypothetical protein